MLAFRYGEGCFQSGRNERRRDGRFQRPAELAGVDQVSPFAAKLGMTASDKSCYSNGASPVGALLNQKN